jgi:O-antigen/teichoic acid export membrane protein
VSRTRRFLGGVAFGYANQALVTLVGLWLTAFLLQRLGQDDYGLWLVGTRILGYLMLLDLGVVALLPREVAFATGRAGGVTGAHDLPEIVGRTARLVFWQLPLVALAAAIIWFALPAEWEPLRDPLGIVMATFVVLFPLRVFQALLNGLQDLAFLGAVHTVSWILGTALTVALVFAGLGLYALAIGWGLTQLLSAILWLVRARRRYGHALRLRFPRFAPDQLRDRLTRSGWISISQVAQVFLSGTDLLIVGKIMGAAAVVPYFCTAKLIVVFANQPKMLAEAAQPALSELRTGAPRERVAEVCTALTRAILIFSGAIVCVVLVVNEGFVGWWVGAEQFGGFDLTVVLLAAMVLRHWYSAVVRALFAFGQDRRISLTTLFDGLLTVGVSIVLVTRMGLIGAALGSLIGVVVIGLPGTLGGLAREMSVPTHRLVTDLWPWLWRCALVAGLAGTVGQRWTPDSVPTLVVATLAAVAAYGAVMLPFALRDPLGLYVRPRLEALRRLVLGSAASGDAE